MDKELLQEGRLGDAIVVALIAKKLLKPIEKTDAYKLGLINEKGKRIRRPKTSEEKKAYTLLDKLVFKLKKLLGHRLANISTFLLLLSDVDVEEEYEKLIQEYENERR